MMNKLLFPILYILLLFTSCASNEASHETPIEKEDLNGILCTVAPLEEVDVTGSRSTLTVGSSGMVFAWEEGEKITVFADAQNKGDFTLESFTDANHASALFSGGGFDLKEGSTYYTLSKSTSKYGPDADKQNHPGGLVTDSWTNISVSYSGQRMTSNGNTDHLGKYDYMSAKAVAVDNNHARFEFQHLGLTLRLVFKDLPAGVKYTNLKMYDASDDAFRELSRNTNITSTKSTETYTPFLNEPALSESSVRFSIDLGTDENTGISVSSGQNLEVYMEVPPFDFTGKTIAFRLTPKNQSETVKPRFSTYKGLELKAGKAYKMTMNTFECANFNVNVQVEHDWAKGNVQSRSAGDPGVTDDIVLPTHLYAFFVNNGRLVQMGSLEGLTEDNWTTVNNISTLKTEGTSEATKKLWTIKGESKETTNANLVLDNSAPVNPRVYMIASTSEIKTWKNSSGQVITLACGTSNGTEEDVIRGLSYDYSANIKNLYSTPWAESNFTGSLSVDDDVKDVRLYHVASKVDINWESASALPTTGDNAFVKVNNFPTTNLSFFTPTNCGGTGSTTVSTPITTGTAYNGRAVFYLPQPSSATYNVTIGSGAAQDINFTPDPVFTSWFRGLITIKD